jgi:hypothetical protein
MKRKQAAEQHSTQPPQGMNEAEFENWLWMLDEVPEDQVGVLSAT